MRLFENARKAQISFHCTFHILISGKHIVHFYGSCTFCLSFFTILKVHYVSRVLLVVNDYTIDVNFRIVTFQVRVL